MSIYNLSYKSLKNRRTTAILTVFTVAISVLLLLAVERIRLQAKQSFANTISNTDLIVGARSGQVNLLLYSVFRIGNSTNNIDWQSYQKIISEPAVKWSIPISLGDSHRGSRVIGTNQDYFKFYQYGKKQPLTFSQGHAFSNMFDTVLGSEVAKRLDYKLGSEIIIAHGISDKKFNRHKNSPFIVTGILAPTGTPVDKSVHVSLAAIEAIHAGGIMTAGGDQNNVNRAAYQPQQITAFLLGLHSKVKSFALQRKINTYRREPLSAIMPGIALHELWGIMSVAEQALQGVAIFVVIAAMLAMLSNLLSSLQERRREMAILRGMGARPLQIFMLLISEASLLTTLGIATGIALLFALLGLFSPLVSREFGLNLSLSMLTSTEWRLIALVQISGMLIGFIPAFNAYRNSLADGMTIKV
ncbi:MAG: ABC transporter permease [Oceanospirillaceae bacterium]|nr:ABC transporter permease [Oceanospirillaceae bacterium]